MSEKTKQLKEQVMEKIKEMYLKYYNHFDGYHNIYKIKELNELINNLL